MADKYLSEEDIEKLNDYTATTVQDGDGSEASVRIEFQPRFIGYPGGINEGIQGLQGRVNVTRADFPSKTFEVNPIFPLDIVEVGQLKLWGSDEGFAALMTGFIRALRPEVVLEIGTNHGRTAAAIAAGLVANGSGHLWTLDMVDFGIHETGALSDQEKPYVTQLIGKTPDCYKDMNVNDIEFAFLDGGHTEKEVMEDLAYVYEHKAPVCIVLIDNARDSQWPELQEMFKTYSAEPNLLLDTMCGCQIIRLGS